MGVRLLLRDMLFSFVGAVGPVRLSLWPETVRSRVLEFVRGKAAGCETGGLLLPHR